MYKSETVEKIIEKSKGLNRREVMHALGRTSMVYTHSIAGRRVHETLNEESSFQGIEPIEMVKQSRKVDTAEAAYWLNVVFNLGVKEDVTPSEYARIVAEEAEALRRENETFLNDGMGLLDWAHACLNDNDEENPMRNTWSYKVLKESMEGKIPVLREKLAQRKWESDKNERRFIYDSLRALKNTCRVLRGGF